MCLTHFFLLHVTYSEYEDTRSWCVCKTETYLFYSDTPSFHRRDIMNNKVFYQHPNLMRALGMHETVMEVMVNVLSGGDSKV